MKLNVSKFILVLLRFSICFYPLLSIKKRKEKKMKIKRQQLCLVCSKMNEWDQMKALQTAEYVVEVEQKSIKILLKAHY